LRLHNLGEGFLTRSSRLCLLRVSSGGSRRSSSRIACRLVNGPCRLSCFCVLFPGTPTCDSQLLLGWWWRELGSELSYAKRERHQDTGNEISVTDTGAT